MAVRKMSDRKLAELGRQYKAINTQLLDQLAARDVDTLEVHGVLLQRQKNTTKTYDVPGLAKRLGRRLAARAMPRRVDGRTLAAMVKRGDVKQTDVDACLISSTSSAPFLKVTIKTEG